MPAPSTVQKGLDYTLRISSGTVIGGGKNATLTQSQEYIETTNKGSSEWRTGLSGVRSWSVSFDGEFLESSAEISGTTMNFLVGSTSGSGGVAVKGMKEITLDLSCNLLPSVSTTTGLDRDICPSTRSATITVSGEWYDFDLDASPTGGDEALEDLVDRLDGTATTAVECTLTFGSAQKYYGNVRPGSFEIGTPHDGIIPYSITLENVGALTPTTTNADGGVIALIADFFDSGGVAEVGTALLSTGTTDSTEWTGSAYPESISIGITYEGTVQISGTLQGHGPLTKQATT